MIYYEAKNFPEEGLEATGEDVTVHVPKGTPWRTYELYGDEGGSITVKGDGDGNAFRSGAGNGKAERTGSGYGHALRDGSGKGNAYINGVKQ